MSAKDGRPQGASWLTPYLTVADADASLIFYQLAFGFERSYAMQGSDGRTNHASMNYQGSTVVMFSPEGAMGNTVMRTPAHSGMTPPFNFYVYCPDVDALTARAKDAGAEVLLEPQDMFWGDRMSQLRDPDGYLWSFATNTRDFDPTQLPK